MEAALEKHATTLNLDLTNYNDSYFNEKNRQASVAQYVIDSKKLKASALTAEDVQKAVMNGVAYEEGKLAFSTKLMDNDLLVTDFQALYAVYLNEADFRGGQSEISQTALKAIEKVLELDMDQKLLLIQALENQFSNESEPGQNPFKINDVFKYINQYTSQG